MESSDARWLEWSLPALAWVGGSLDAVSYLELGHVFTANMTGNTVLMAMALGAGNMTRTLRSLLAVLGFGFGVAAGTRLLRGQATGWSKAVNRVLLLEAALLCISVVVFGSATAGALPLPWMYGLIPVLGIVMGMQSAAMRKVHLAGVWTTFITGTLTEGVAGLVERTPPKGLPVVSIQAAVYLTYGLGALVTTWLERRWPPWGAVLPLIVLLVVVARGEWRARAVRQDQSA